MKNIKYLVVLLCMTFVSVSLLAQERKLQTESDGFQWYELRQGDKRGAQSVGGVTFIPLSRGYTFICYFFTDGGWFSVRKGEKKNGVCDITGREIIAPGRYDWAEFRNKDGFEYCYVELNGKKGACDRNGQEIVAPRYESLLLLDGVFEYEDASGKWVSTGIKLSSLAQTPSTNPTPSPAPSPTPQPQPQPQPEPRPQPRPMQVWKPCVSCGGSGQCHICLGTGHSLQNPNSTCILCNGTGRCTHCAGHGGQNVIEYH